MFSRFFQRLSVILFSMIYLGGTAAWSFLLHEKVDWWWLALYTLVAVIFWIRQVRKFWPKTPATKAH